MTQFGLDTIVALLAIVAGVSGAFHKLILKPIILNFEAARQLDRTKQEAQFKLLQNTLVDLKEEIKISRAQRSGFDAKLSAIETRCGAFDDRIDALEADIASLQSHLYERGAQ